ncbi:MAG: glycerophosphodiester phosphodiesterase [Pseudomonadota bacterium]
MEVESTARIEAEAGPEDTEVAGRRGKRMIPRLLRLALLATLLMGGAWAAAEPLVIAHRGVSGYLPEHSAASKVLAHAMGVDYIEQDVVLSRDRVPVVFHDLTLDATTDVRLRFPERAADDGRYYVADFDWAELATLRIGPRIDVTSGERIYPTRYAGPRSLHPPVRLDDELMLIAELNRLLDKDIGVYVELKRPAWHRARGLDISRAVLAVMTAHGYTGRTHRAFLQTFDFEELRRLRIDLGSELRLIQLIGENDWDESPTDYDWLRSEVGVAVMAAVADGVGAWMPQLVDDALHPSAFRQRLRDRQLPVHVYTLRADVLPPQVADFETLIRIYVDAVGVEGIFTDQPDRVLRYLGRQPGSAE